MNQKATFNIEGSFKISGRGIVIYGDIIDGEASPDNFIVFESEKKKMKLKIKGIDFVDSIKDKISKTGLTFYYNSDNERDILENLKVIKQTATITDI